MTQLQNRTIAELQNCRSAELQKWFGCVCFGFAVLAASAAHAADPSGEEVYKQHCAACHDQVSPRIPPRESLKALSAARILRSLDFGAMMSIAYPLKREQRDAVARFLGKSDSDDAPPRENACPTGRRIMAASTSVSWNGWSPGSSNARYQGAREAGITPAQVRNLKLKWALGFAGDITALGAPTIVSGTLFVGSAGGTVQAIDVQTGCTHWVFQANGPVRAALLAVPTEGTTSLVFGDQVGWFYSVDALTGRLRWKRRVEEHEATRLTASAATHDGLIFVPAASWEETRALDPQYPCCTFRGSVTALHAKDGSQVWKTYLVPPPAKTGVTTVGTERLGPSGAGIWSAPTIDPARGLLYVTTGDNYSSPATETSDAVVGLELKTGRIAWVQQTTPNDVYNSSCGRQGPNCPPGNGPDHDFGSSAILTRTPNGRELLVAGQKSGVVYALDPDAKGRVVWQTRVGNGGVNGGVQWGMASDERRVYAAVSDAVRLPATGSATLGDGNFDPVRGGGLTALGLEDGVKAWVRPGRPCNPPRPGCSPAQSAALSAIPGVVFSGSLDGYLRAFSADEGQLLWEVDTARPYVTVNGVPARGGSLDGAGPVVAGGMLLVNSGYPRFGGAPGNVLLAFEASSEAP
jgi:polyvinyl alcohol dehydrogenase (cytochrome)